MKKPISIYKFKLKNDGKTFMIKRNEIVVTLLTLVIIWMLVETIPWIFLIPTFLIICILTVFFRPKPKFEITSEMLNNANGDGPFIYETDGFFIEKHESDRYSIIDLSIESPELPVNPAKQYWSWSGMTEEEKIEIELRLNS